ncbi:hypothetical protein FCM35_KLT18400 [Carex littledalei]|uniref:TPX2 C-terminal domain-containing protein n=1 Tax=Carex littledalei TaxID=544730 RepID=A0A833VW60_9POAL|nr:hypothetical protein FCM35_KLT18400 [Carex littledalei]
MATQVDIPFQGWSLSGQDQSKEGGNGLVQEMLDHGSISFGRYAIEPLSWEKYSVFNHDTCQEELGKLTYPGLVAQKKAYFEEYYKKIRALKAMEEEKSTEIENTHETLIEHIEIDPKIDKTMKCEVDASKFSVPEVVVQNELLHENESTGKEIPLQFVLRNIVEHEMKSMLDSDSLSTSCVTDVAMGNDVNQAESGVVNSSQLVRRKTVNKVEHEKKLMQDFDSLSKDWVKFKKGLASIGRKESGESTIDDKNGNVASAVTKSFRADKDMTISRGNLLGQKVHMPQIKLFKEPKQPTQKANSADTKSTRLSKPSTGYRVAFNSRPNSLSSHNRPLRRAKSSLPSPNEATRVRSKTIEKSASNPSLSKGKSTRRSSLDSLMKPTASSNARSIQSEVKSFRNSGVVKKPLPSRVPKVLKRDTSHSVLPKRRSSNVLAQDKLPKTRSDMASKTPLHGKKPRQAKIVLTSRKRVEPKKALDLNTRSKKLVTRRKEASLTYNRTKLNEDSPLKKNQRHEKPPWR